MRQWIFKFFSGVNLWSIAMKAYKINIYFGHKATVFSHIMICWCCKKPFIEEPTYASWCLWIAFHIPNHFSRSCIQSRAMAWAKLITLIISTTTPCLTMWAKSHGSNGLDGRLWDECYHVLMCEISTSTEEHGFIVRFNICSIMHEARAPTFLACLQRRPIH